MIWKCVHCGSEYDEDDLERIDEYEEGWHSGTYLDTDCPCCGNQLEETRECEECGELVCESNVYLDEEEDVLCCPDCYEERKVNRVIKKFIKAKETMEEIEEDMLIYSNIYSLQLRNEKDFRSICKVLKLEIKQMEIKEEDENVHFYAEYKDFRIVWLQERKVKKD